MIAKGKAVAHGKQVLEYIFREAKLNFIVGTNNLGGQTPEAIEGEMREITQFNSRCKNRFLRFEIGIAPDDEQKLSRSELRKIVNTFSNKMGLDKHQWIAVTHKDTDNLHIHLVANRIGMDGSVYQTDFVSNRAARAAEEISRAMSLTIAKEVRAKRVYKDRHSSKSREAKKQGIQKIAYMLLKAEIDKGQLGKQVFVSFMKSLNEQGITEEVMRNKQGKAYGFRFHYEGETFKASEIGREFGYRSLFRQFGLEELVPQKGQTVVPILKDNPQILRVTLENVFEAVEEITSDISVSDLLDTPTQSVDYKEMTFQKKMKRIHQKQQRKGRRR